jgi:two-component system, sensor histidine kinase PdtaS
LDVEGSDKMTIEQSPQRANALNVIFENREHPTVTSYKRELVRHRRTENGLREALARERAALAREEALLSQKDELIQQQAILRQEADHRLLNGLQMVVSLLSLQGRASDNAEVVSQLAAAADRIATIGRIHRRLHSFDGVQTFALKQYIEDLCGDFSMMLSTEHPERIIAVEGIEVELPAATAIPLGFIASELITNAAKYGTGRITVGLEANPSKGYALSVASDGPALSQDFDPAAGKGLGMRIIRSLVERIGGEFRIGRGDNNQGARFTVLFS